MCVCVCVFIFVFITSIISISIMSFHNIYKQLLFISKTLNILYSGIIDAMIFTNIYSVSKICHIIRLQSHLIKLIMCMFSKICTYTI